MKISLNKFLAFNISDKIEQKNHLWIELRVICFHPASIPNKPETLDKLHDFLKPQYSHIYRFWLNEIISMVP